MSDESNTVVPYSEEYEDAANKLAREYVHIYPCGGCGYPVKKNFCCDNCGSNEPYRKRA